MVRVSGILLKFIVMAVFVLAGESQGQSASYLDDLPKVNIDPGAGEEFIPAPYKKTPPTVPPPTRHFYVDASGMIACGDIDGNVLTPLNLNLDDPQSKYNNDGVKLFHDVSISGDKHHSQLQVVYNHFHLAVHRGPLFFPFYYNLATVALRLKMYEKARIYFAKAADLVPKFWGSYIGLGRSYELLGRKLDAVAAFRTAIKNNPLNYDAGVALGDYYYREKLYSRAAYYYNFVIRRFPENPDATVGLGKIAHARKAYFEATLILGRLNFDVLKKKKTPYRKEAHYYYARALTELREFKRAVVQFDELLKHPEDLFFIEVPYSTIVSQRKVVDRLAKVKASQTGQ